MVKHFTVNNFYSRFLIILAMIISLVVISPSAFAQYGACNYSEGSFSQEDHSCVPADSEDGELSGTGSNWQYLLMAAVGLVVALSSTVAVVVILKKLQNNKSNQVKINK